jgi:putative transposase
MTLEEPTVRAVGRYSGATATVEVAFTVVRFARRHIRIADKRRDFHFHLAHEIFDHYATVVFEGIKRFWGCKVSDLGFGQFVNIVKWVATKRGKRVVIIDCWERTTQKCSTCGRTQKFELKDRVFACQYCGLSLGRDRNAALNIFDAEHRLILSQSEQVLA